MQRFASLVVLVTAVLAAASPAAAATPRHLQAGTISVTGAVAMPTTYSLSQLEALPQVTVPDVRSRRAAAISGVDLESLVDASSPTLPAGKNPLLRAVVTVSGRLGSSTFALGELDPGFGDHPALLALRFDGRVLPGGPYLAVPGDNGYRRTVISVTSLAVGVVMTSTPSGVPTGSVLVDAGRRQVTLNAASVAALPRTSATITFSAGGMPQTHTEAGPTLAAVLRAARVPTSPSTVVTAVGDDGYAAVVTLGEATSGRRPLILSTVEDGALLPEPRLIAVGDLKGGRDVSGVRELMIGTPRRG